MRVGEWLATLPADDLAGSLRAAAEFLDAAETGPVLRQLVSPNRARRLVDLGLELDHVALLGAPCSPSRLRRLAGQVGCTSVRSFRSRVLALELRVPIQVYRLARRERSIEVFVPRDPPRRVRIRSHIAFRTPAEQLERARLLLRAAGFRVPVAFAAGFVLDGDGSPMMYFDKPGLRVEVFARGVL